MASVSISLIINNGILDKAKSAVDKYSEGEITEQIKLAYLECQMSKFTDNSQELEQALKEKLEKVYGEGNIDIISSEETIVLKVVANGESKFYEYNPSTNISKELPKGINYNGKTPSEIQPGDDITIVTEKFKVFAVENNIIKAIPYYNLKIDESTIKQVTASKAGSDFSGNAGFVAFANNKQKYWEEETDIDMNVKNGENYKNNIQEFIDSYQELLEKLGANVTARIARHAELKDFEKDNLSRNYLNPSFIGSYWLGTSNKNNDVYSVQGQINGNHRNGINPNLSYYNGESIGVRPIIEIPIE